MLGVQEELGAQVIAAGAEPGRVGVQGPAGRGGRAAEGGLERRNGELVHADRSGQRMAAEKLDELGAPEEQTCLGTAEQLVSTTCLLYTSDAADEEDSVDLGGRR